MPSTWSLRWAIYHGGEKNSLGGDFGAFPPEQVAQKSRLSLSRLAGGLL
jgi:hypothetical protein